MLENLEKKLVIISTKFDELSETIKNKKDEIENLKNEMSIVLDEQKRLQGEYRVIKDLINEIKNQPTENN